MTKVVVLALATVAGSVLGVLVFLVIDSHFQLPLDHGELGMWNEYGSLSFAGVGAICGVVTGRVACGWKDKREMHAPVPSETAFEEVAVAKPRKNIRPLTWLFRA